MPNYWVGINLSPPQDRLDRIEKALRRFRGRVRERQVYTDRSDRTLGYAMIKVPPDTVAEEVREAIEATSLLEVIDLEEYVEEFEPYESTE